MEPPGQGAGQAVHVHTEELQGGCKAQSGERDCGPDAQDLGEQGLWPPPPWIIKLLPSASIEGG